MLLLPDPHIVGCRGNHVAGGYPDAAPGSVGLPPGVHNLPVLVIGKADRPLIAPEKRAVGSDHLNGSVLQCNLQLCQKLRLHAVLAGQSPGAHTAPIPAVSQGEEQFILAGPQQLRHIIGLVLQTHSIVGNTGRQHKIAGTLPVDPGLVVPAGGHPGGSIQRKFLFKQIYRVPLLLIRHIIPGNPGGLPVRRIQQSHLKERLLAPVPFRVVFIPELYLPENTVPAL